MADAALAEDERIRSVEDYLFLCGVGDLAEQLCRVNMRVGLAKVRHAEAQLGLPPTACFIGTPDATVTRNTQRWAAGFGYGGLVCWHPQLVVLDAKPNACGMLVGAPAVPPEEDRVREAAARARRQSPVLDGVELRYDLDESNHFVDGLQLEEVLVPSLSLPEHLFILHSSGHEHRASSPWGPGLYLDESPQLREQARSIETPWGAVHVLRGEAALDYQRFYSKVERFNARRRQLYADLLFGSHRLLANPTHQGLRQPGQLLLGAYGTQPGGLFPLTLGPDQPVYLIRAEGSFSAQAIRQLGWEPRADRLGLRPLLLAANLLPHGGGYAYPEFRRLLSVEWNGDRQRLRLQPTGEASPVEFEDVRPLPYGFRGSEVLHRLAELGMGTPVARYRIRFVIK